MKKYICIIFVRVSICTNILQAQSEQNDFLIIPASEQSTEELANTVTEVGSSGGQVRNNYNKAAQDLSLSDQIATGIFTRNTILNYVVYIIRFLSQIGLLIGGVMIIYAGYIYATSIFTGGDASKGNSAIKKAIRGIVIVASSYAIMRILTNAFLS